MDKKIIIGSDHGGFNLKNSIKKYLQDLGYLVEDIGCYSPDSCDYPIIAKELCSEIVNGKFKKGILICGSGVGMSIAANKVKGIRAVLADNTYTAKMSRKHNNSNVLCMGERVIGADVAFDIVEIWLDTEFEAGRHKRRVDMFE